MKNEPLISSNLQSSSTNHKNFFSSTSSPLADVNDSSSCSSSSSSSSSSTTVASVCSSSTATTNNSLTVGDNNNPIISCDLLNIITDTRFRPIFQAIEEIKKRNCQPDFERILKYAGKPSPGITRSHQRNEILLMINDLLRLGVLTKILHKGGFTIRIANEKYARLIEKMNICYNQKIPAATPMSPQETMAVAVAAGVVYPNNHQLITSKHLMLNSSDMGSHKQCDIRRTPSPEFAVSQAESSSKYRYTTRNDTAKESKVSRENSTTNGSIFMTPSSVPLLSVKSNKRRKHSPMSSLLNQNKKHCTMETSTSPFFLPSSLCTDSNNGNGSFRVPSLSQDHLPPVTIEQLLGLRGDIPDVREWSTQELSDFFHQQGFEYATTILYKHHINGKKLYDLGREEVFRISTLKIGKAIKLWNVIEQIQRKNSSSLS